jgi:hypothetical protein
MILTTQAALRKARHVEGLQFRCGDCKQVKPVGMNGGTGYGYFGDKPRARPICYECCGIREREAMIRDGKACLYLSKDGDGWKITNWPGTLVIKTRWVRKGSHNIARTRYDVWFTGPDGKQWHGVNIGENSQVCRCRRLKS